MRKLILRNILEKHTASLRHYFCARPISYYPADFLREDFYHVENNC
jgi:hypothetical protein